MKFKDVPQFTKSAGGVAHTEEEIDKVRQMLKEQK